MPDIDPNDTGIHSPIWFLFQNETRDLRLQTSSLGCRIVINEPLVLPVEVTLTVQPDDALPHSPLVLTVTEKDSALTVNLTPHVGDLSLRFTAAAKDANGLQAKQIRFYNLRG